MHALDLARWQFAITTVYHFFFVPITIGLSALVAGLQTAWVRTGKEQYLRATKFWGKLFLINFAMGVVTGIVQEFQFGMNWSDYSRFVGDIFGAPLAIEGLLAFFLESTFLGLWIFGWDRLPKRVHLATIWLASIGTMLSAYFILAANSWMQHPVGYTVNTAPRPGRTDRLRRGADQLDGAGHVPAHHHRLLPHRRRRSARDQRLAPAPRQPDRGVPARACAWAPGWCSSPALGVLVTGDLQARVMTEQQPMKMAAAEALYNTSAAGLVLAVHDRLARRRATRWPACASRRCCRFLATGGPNGQVEGINDLQAAVRAALRRRRLHAERPDHLLVVPADDRLRRAGRC